MALYNWGFSVAVEDFRGVSFGMQEAPLSGAMADLGVELSAISAVGAGLFCIALLANGEFRIGIGNASVRS